VHIAERADGCENDFWHSSKVAAERPGEFSRGL
jgi:hypothetical protein